MRIVLSLYLRLSLLLFFLLAFSVSFATFNIVIATIVLFTQKCTFCSTFCHSLIFHYVSLLLFGFQVFNTQFLKSPEANRLKFSINCLNRVNQKYCSTWCVSCDRSILKELLFWTFCFPLVGDKFQVSWHETNIHFSVCHLILIHSSTISNPFSQFSLINQTGVDSFAIVMAFSTVLFQFYANFWFCCKWF